MLRGRDNWLFVFWPLFECFGLIEDFVDILITTTKPQSPWESWRDQPFVLPDVLEPQYDHLGHVGEVGHGHEQVVLHTHLVEADRFRTYSLILKSYIILIILQLLQIFLTLTWSLCRMYWGQRTTCLWPWPTSPTCPTSPSWSSGTSTSTSRNTSTYSCMLPLLRYRHCFWLLNT